MSKPFQFADMVNDFYVPFMLFTKTEGYYDKSGDWHKGEEIAEERGGIVLPLSEDDLRFVESGSYNEKNKKIYTTEPLEQNAMIEYKGDKYTITTFKDYSDYADVFIYYARWREK